MMNDRFKFRAWNKLSNEMKDVIRLNINYDFPDCSNVVLETNTFDAIKTHNNPINCSVGLKHVVIMQCTGLKDKNGKLIYEGDIVTDGYHNMEVYYNQIDCRFILKKVTKYIIKRFGKGSFEHCYLMDRTEDNKCKDHWYKVIGNIYENPELLQECE